MKLYTFLDVEASGLKLPASYPIEIGWADTLENHDSFLILPEPSWEYWDNAAEAVHGIRYDQLLEQGISVTEAAKRLDQSLGLETVYCDAVDFDSFWLRKLFASAGIEMSFELTDIHELYSDIGPAHAAELSKILASIPPLHRAGADAERYATAYRELRKQLTPPKSVISSRFHPR